MARKKRDPELERAVALLREELAAEKAERRRLIEELRASRPGARRGSGSRRTKRGYAGGRPAHLEGLSDREYESYKRRKARNKLTKQERRAERDADQDEE